MIMMMKHKAIFRCKKRRICMAYIRTIPESEAEGKLADLYRKYGNPDGSVDNVLKTHSLNPASLEAHCLLYVQSMHRPSPLSRAEREMVAVTVSRLNGCNYCRRHHGVGLRRLLPEARKRTADEVMEGEWSGLTTRETAMVTYATKLATTPGEMSRADVEALHSAGLTDREILDLAQVVGYFAFANRIVLGLGAELEDDERLGFWPSPDGE